MFPCDGLLFLSQCNLRFPDDTWNILFLGLWRFPRIGESLEHAHRSVFGQWEFHFEQGTYSHFAAHLNAGVVARQDV